MRDASENIKANMIFLRKKSGLTQAQVANYLDVDPDMVSKFENGSTPTSAEIVEKLSALYSCSLECSRKSIEEESIFLLLDGVYKNREDLQAIASVNRIAMNLGEMKNLLDEAGRNQDLR